MTTELDEYQKFFDEYQKEVDAVLEGLPAAALNWRPLETGDEHTTNSLAVMVTHVGGSQQYWGVQVAAGGQVTRDRAAEFRVEAGDAAELRQRLAACGQQVREALAGLTNERLDETVEADGRQITRRWALFHIVRHSSLHLGHMQLTRQMWEASTRRPPES